MGWKNYETTFRRYLWSCKRNNSKPTVKTEQEYFEQSAKIQNELDLALRRQGLSENEISESREAKWYGLAFDEGWRAKGHPTIYLTESLVSLIENAKFSDENLAESIIERWPFNFPVVSIIMEKNFPPFLIRQFGNEKDENKRIALAVNCTKLQTTIHVCLLEKKAIQNMLETDFDKLHSIGRGNSNYGNLLKKCFCISLRLQIYIQAFPDAIRPGFPDGMSNYEQKQQNTARAFRIGLPAKYHNSPLSHWRSGHFRRLMDEKFKRDEQGQARIIYVNPCLVGEKVDPYTVEKSN